MPQLTVEHIAVGYHDFLVLDELSVKIPEKKITTIIGPNGCGKSTLLKTISRLLRAQRGAIFLDGRAIQN